MTAKSINVYTEVLTNPEWSDGEAIQPTRLKPNISFDQSWQNMQTLSSHDTEPGMSITGFLFVPNLQSGDPCIQESAPWVPQNATRLANLPPMKDIKLIAMAPWTSANCTLNYLAAARVNPIIAMLFFLPNDNTTTPSRADSAWSISSTSSWEDQNEFPIYAISGSSGSTLMKASAEYSSNMTQVPYGHILTESYDSRYYVRLMANIQTTAPHTIPSLWIFLLVVLGIMTGIILLTSGTMHLLQRRRRSSLRQRVARGEVDLEALGIKRLTVPQHILDQMPLYTYGSGAPAELNPVARDSTTPEPVAAEKLDSPPSTRPSSPAQAAPATRVLRATTSHRPTILQQPTCAICLDDFIPASGGTQGTIVRELPCQHIFHPECVDTFLRDNSSLCPMCKKTALPIGYCPRAITNAMVRRERMVRRLRPRADSFVEARNGRDRARRSTFGLNRLSARNEDRTTSVNDHTPTRHNMEPPVISASSPGEAAAAEPDVMTRDTPVQPSSNPRRREWARQRAVAMLGSREAPADPDAEEAQTLPRWRKALTGLFPSASR